MLLEDFWLGLPGCFWDFQMIVWPVQIVLSLLKVVQVAHAPVFVVQQMDVATLAFRGVAGTILAAFVANPAPGFTSPAPGKVLKVLMMAAFNVAATEKVGTAIGKGVGTVLAAQIAVSVLGLLLQYLD